MSKLLGKEAYDAARKQTVEKLRPMLDAFIEIIKSQRDLDSVSDGTDLISTSVEINEKSA